jgi:LysR family transcriptional regulator (chromosome initiation inhibitor)
MIEVQPEQARTLAAIVDAGTFDAAARALNLTPSAVSQRVRALETAVGRPVLRRVRPVELTESGQSVLRFARQLALLGVELAGELEPDASPAPRVTVVVNSDSLHTWALAGLARVAGRVRLEVLREDQEHSLDLLRTGAAAAAVTSTAAPVPGCTVRRLGVMRYRPVCSPAMARACFGDGVSAQSLAVAPVLCFDRKDDLQDRFLRGVSRGRLDPPRHYVPATHEYAAAVRLGLGWGLLPELQLDDDLETGALVPLSDTRVDVALHWQQWRLASPALQEVAAAILEAARVLR